MSWEPPASTDAEIRGWMNTKGWVVTAVHYDFSREIYAWRHEVHGKPSPTLRISQQVLEDYPAFAILEHLDRLNVAAAVSARPAARLVLIQNGARVILEEAPE